MATLFLIGPRGSGKTTVGRCLARLLDKSFLDTDQLVAEAAGQSIAGIVAAKGWSAFRDLESECLARAAGSGAVTATGGGVVLSPQNCELMRASGPVFYLHCPVEVLAARLSANLSAKDRPSLTGRDPIEEAAAVLAEREPLYRRTAHFIVAADDDPDSVARNVAKAAGLPIA